MSTESVTYTIEKQIILLLIENQLSPRLLGKSIGVHPLIALIALVAGAELFGVVGAIFGPMVAGLAQAVSQASWSTWRANHPEEFVAEVDEREEKQNQVETG